MEVRFPIGRSIGDHLRVDMKILFQWRPIPEFFWETFIRNTFFAGEQCFRMIRGDLGPGTGKLEPLHPSSMLP
jgi:hypothetical protein